MAYDNFRRQIEVLEHNGIDDINLPTQYASLAQCALELDMPDSAFVALQKAAALPKRTTYQEFTVNKGFGLYYIRCGNFAEAENGLRLRRSCSAAIPRCGSIRPDCAICK